MELIAQCKGERFTMTRWGRSKGATVDNMLFLTEDTAEIRTTHQDQQEVIIIFFIYIFFLIIKLL